LFLVGQQKVGGLKFMEKFLGGAFRRVKLEAFLEVKADGIGDSDAEESRLADDGRLMLCR